jgi:polyhydroxyalkanoate synthesis regulator phasin
MKEGTTMLDLLRRLIVAGLDTQAKVVDFLDELVKKGKIDEAERARFMEELDKKISHSKERSEELINELTNKIMAKNPFVCKKDVDALNTRIDELVKRVAKLEKVKKSAK